MAVAERAAGTRHAVRAHDNALRGPPPWWVWPTGAVCSRFVRSSTTAAVVVVIALCVVHKNTATPGFALDTHVWMNTVVRPGVCEK